MLLAAVRAGWPAGVAPPRATVRFALMLLRAVVGFALLVGFLVLGAAVVRLRSAGRMPWRRLAGSVDRTIGIVAIALLVVLVLGVVRLAL